MDASGAIARKIAPLLFVQDNVSKEEKQSRAVFEGLQKGKNAVRCLPTTRTVTSPSKRCKTSPAAWVARRTAGVLPNHTPGTRRHDIPALEVRFPQKTLEIWERIMPDGKIEQYQVAAKN